MTGERRRGKRDAAPSPAPPGPRRGRAGEPSPWSLLGTNEPQNGNRSTSRTDLDPGRSPAPSPFESANGRRYTSCITSRSHHADLAAGPARPGYFGERSAIRRIARESVLMLGGPRALLMQAAHPLVAAGIVDHSRYREDPWRRLARTMAALYTIVFGTRAQADRMGELTRAAHRHVRGERGGVAYDASDPELMLWVHSTLVDTGLAMHETFVGPVGPDTAEEFYAQMRVVGTVFGVPVDAHPPTLADFRAYQRRMLAGEVRVAADARAVAETVLRPPVPLPLRPPLRALALQSAGTLPPALREQYGLRFGPLERAVLRASSRSARRLVPLVPAPLRRTERLPLRLLTAFAGLG